MTSKEETIPPDDGKRFWETYRYLRENSYGAKRFEKENNPQKN